MGKPPEKSTERLVREKRLADALRQNLRRRKAQTRARAEGGATAADLAAEKPKK